MKSKKEVSKRKLPVGTTEKQLEQFWNHKINPVTGFKMTPASLRTQGDRDEAKSKLERKKIFNKVEYS